MTDFLIAKFESRYGIKLRSRLGDGRDGEVYATNCNTAVKLLVVQESFRREWQVYEALAKAEITSVAGHAVPRFIRADEEFVAIEMTIVEPPFLLDFVSAYPVKTAPQFSDEVWEQWYAEKREQFGDRWPEVELVLSEFRRLTGFVLLDVNPGNIRFES